MPSDSEPSSVRLALHDRVIRVADTKRLPLLDNHLEFVLITLQVTFLPYTAGQIVPLGELL